MLDALSIFEEVNVDFSDAVIAAEMSAADVEAIYSFDRDFDRISGISRFEPEGPDS
jgi:predicted nucleic acid-binding protein